MKLILKYDNYLTLGKKYYILFSYQTGKEVIDTYKFVREEIIPKYSCEIDFEEEKNEYMYPFMIDRNGNCLYGPNQLNTQMYGGINIPENYLKEVLNAFMARFNAKLQVGTEIYPNLLLEREMPNIKKALRPELNNYYHARNIRQLKEILPDYGIMDKMELDAEILGREKELEEFLEEMPKVMQNMKTFLQIRKNLSEFETFQTKMDIQKLKTNFNECNREKNFIASMHNLLNESIIEEYQGMPPLEQDFVTSHFEILIKEVKEQIKIKEQEVESYQLFLKQKQLTTEIEEEEFYKKKITLRKLEIKHKTFEQYKEIFLNESKKKK